MSFIEKYEKEYEEKYEEKYEKEVKNREFRPRVQGTQ